MVWMAGLPGGWKNCLDCQVQRAVIPGVQSNGQLLNRVANGASAAFARDVWANKLNHEAACILCKCADDTKLGARALHARRPGSYSEGARRAG